MAVQNLLEAIGQFGAAPDPTSRNGQLLADLVPEPGYALGERSGKAHFAVPRGLGLTSGGVEVSRQGDGGGGIVLPLPAPLDFTIRAAPGGEEVAIKLVTPKLPLPGLTAAQPDADGTPRRTGGDVSLVFPDLTLVIPGFDAVVRLDPLFPPAGVVEVTMAPPLAVVGPGEAVAIGMERGRVELGAAPKIVVPELRIYVTPPGIPALAMKGMAAGFEIGLGGNAGLSGEAQLEPRSEPAQRPAFLDQIKGRIRLLDSVVTLLELSGEVKLRERIAGFFGSDDPDAPERIGYLARLVPTPAHWEVSLQLRGAGDSDFLWRTKAGTLGDAAGAYAVFAPMFAGALAPGASGLVKVGATAGLITPIVAAGIFKARAVTVLGGELRLVGAGDEAFLFLDIETEFDLDMKVIKTRRPLKVRQKAIGFSLAFVGDDGLQPVFDPTRGFSLDLSDPSAFEVPNGPLGDLLQPDRARVAKENPLRIEIDLVPKLNLGIVTVDRTTAFVEIDRAGAKGGISALAVHLDAGPLRGSGYLSVGDDALVGGIDLFLPEPLSLRLNGQLAYANRNGQMALYASIGVGWPVPMPIANSGLGLYEISGLLGIRYEPAINDGQTALDWVTNSGFRPTDAEQWRPVGGDNPDNLAFGVGAALGTLEGGLLFNGKGVLILELPGPRIMLPMRADILSPRGRFDAQGSILAAVEITPEQLAVGLVAEQSWGGLLKVRVPASARFSFGDITDWALDIGGFPEDQPPGVPVSISFLNRFEADGYIVIRGNGIRHFPLRSLPGFAVAAGVRASILWGAEEIGLYTRVAASVDLGVNFTPSIFAIGRITLKGELHLFIVGIGVSAEARVMLSHDAFQFTATVCGKVEFLFFDVEGCVTMSFGRGEPVPPPTPRLIRKLSLMSASPALLQGTGADRPIDASLGDAVEGEGALVLSVPIDTVPVIHFESRAFVPDDFRFLGKTALPTPIAAGKWIQRGGQLYRYGLKSLSISDLAADLEETAPLAWWDRHPPSGEYDDGSDLQLALLTPSIDPAPIASEPSEVKRTDLIRRWGELCTPVAEERPVLWTALGQHPGGSAKGWVLEGQVMPDKQGTSRSSPAYTQLTVRETWRSGYAVADTLFAVTPATVIGNSAGNRAIAAPWTGLELKPCSEDGEVLQLLEEWFPGRSLSLPNSLLLESEGFRTLRGLIYLQEGDVKHLVFRLFDANGAVIGEIDGTRMETKRLVDLAALPEEWREAGTPWAAETSRLFDGGQMNTDMSQRFYESTLLYFDCPIDPEAVPHAVEIGWTDAYHEYSFGLVAIESVTQREYLRRQFDEKRQATEIEAVSGALNFDASRQVLLKPGAEYKVTVEYTTETGAFNDKNQPVATPRPADIAAENWPRTMKQSYRFKTDTEPPANIDAWVLATAPNEDEALFYLDPITILFSSARVGKLFKAYDAELAVRVLAASGKHPPSGAAGIPLAELMELVPAVISSPFEAMLTSLPQLTCVPFTLQNRHQQTIIRNALEPSTEYVFELVAGGKSRSRRHNFKTSRYPSLGALAEDVRKAPIGHWFASDTAPIAGLAPGLVADSLFEAALRTLGWFNPEQDRTANRVTVIWQGAFGTPEARPIGVLIETVEPVWRQIRTPQQGGAANPQSRLVARPWVEVRCQRAADIVRSASGTRTLIRLPAGQAGELIAEVARLPSFLGATYAAQPFELVRVDLAQPSQEQGP